MVVVKDKQGISFEVKRKGYNVVIERHNEQKEGRNVYMIMLFSTAEQLGNALITVSGDKDYV